MAAVGRAVMVAVVRAVAEEVGMRRSFVGSVGRKGFFVHDADVKERLTRRVEIPEPSKKAKKTIEIIFSPSQLQDLQMSEGDSYPPVNSEAVWQHHRKLLVILCGAYHVQRKNQVLSRTPIKSSFSLPINR